MQPKLYHWPRNFHRNPSERRKNWLQQQHSSRYCYCHIATVYWENRFYLQKHFTNNRHLSSATKFDSRLNVCAQKKKVSWGVLLLRSIAHHIYIWTGIVQNEKFYKSVLKVYPHELENLPDFNGFKEWLHTFELYRGKKTGDVEDDESRVVGKFKVRSFFRCVKSYYVWYSLSFNLFQSEWCSMKPFYNLMYLD